MENLAVIDAVDLEQEILMVRNKNLMDLVGYISFPAAIYHILTGDLPDTNQELLLNRFMVDSLRMAVLEKNNYSQIKAIAFNQCELESILIMALLIFENFAKEYAMKIMPIELSPLLNAAEGLFLMALLPGVMYQTQALSMSNEDFYKKIIYYCDEYPEDFTALMLALLIKESSFSTDKIMLMNALLVSLHAGFGIITPTIALARFSASTRAPIAKNIVAGLTGCGPAHVGACKAAMALFKKLVEESCQEDVSIQEIFCKLKPIPGFGHPLLNCDPRNKMLLSIVKNRDEQLDYLNIYKKVTHVVMSDYSLQPNIDLIAAAILLDLGVYPSFGTAVFLFARIPTMIAHVIEKQKSPPFGINKKEAREHFSNLPKRWV